MKDLKAGQRVYRVGWTEDGPHIEAGVIVEYKKKSVARRVRAPDGKVQRCSGWSPTMREAIEEELTRAAGRNAGPYCFAQRKPAPWELVWEVTRLWRLYRKLKKHHLV